MNDTELLAKGKDAPALTLHQPWASFIACGAKTYETRSWPTRHRGLLWIHAGKTVDDDYCDEDFTHQIADRYGVDLGMITTGALVCLCDLTEIVKTDSMQVEDKVQWWTGDYSPGRYAWKLDLIGALQEPVPMRGYQSIWRVKWQ